MPRPLKTTSDETRKMQKPAQVQRRRLGSVNLGAEIVSWKVLKEQLGCKNDKELAKLLIQGFKKNDMLVNGLHSSSTPGLLHTNRMSDLTDRPDSILDKLDNLSKTMYYRGCTIKGLPIGVPFTSEVDIPEDRRTEFKNIVDTFIIIRYQLPDVTTNSITSDRSPLVNNGEVKIENGNSSLSDSQINNKHDINVTNMVDTANKRKRKCFNEQRKVKKIKINIDQQNDNEVTVERRSSRTKSAGLRPDYQDIVEENTELEDENVELDQHEKDEETDINSDYHPDDYMYIEDDKSENTYTEKHLQYEKSEDESDNETPIICMKDNETGAKMTEDCKEKDIDHKKEIKTKKRAYKKRVYRKQTETEREEFDELYNAPEFEGLSRREIRNILKRRKTKELALQKEAERIKIKLQDHPDKYRTSILDSFERKNRGKSKEECSMELFVCTVCEKFKAKTSEAMETHIECHVNGDLDCKECDFKASGPGDLLQHRRNVHKKNVHVCQDCGVEISGEDAFKTHLGRVHNKPQWSCKYCPKENGVMFALLTRYDFRKHLREAHQELFEQCDVCKMLLANKYQLTRHKEAGCEPPGAETKEFPCEKCGKTYSNQIRVNAHIQRVHNRVRKHPCPYCPFTSLNPSGLRFHLKVHSGEHPFKCDQCTFSCVQKFQLVSHSRTHTGDKPYKCIQCKYAAAWNVQLKDHIKIHSLPNTILCEMCHIVLRDLRAYKMHFAKEHSNSDNTNSTLITVQSL